MDPETRARLDALMKAIEIRYPNGIAPAKKLRQGCISAVFFDADGNERAGTEEEWDALYDQMDKESKERNAAR